MFRLHGINPPDFARAVRNQFVGVQHIDYVCNKMVEFLSYGFAKKSFINILDQLFTNMEDNSGSNNLSPGTLLITILESLRSTEDCDLNRLIIKIKESPDEIERLVSNELLGHNGGSIFDRIPKEKPAADLYKNHKQHLIDCALELNNHVVGLFVHEVSRDLAFKLGLSTTEVRAMIEDSLRNCGALK